MTTFTATNASLDALTAARGLRSRARSLRAMARTCPEPLAVAYRRRAAELELLAAIKQPPTASRAGRRAA